MEFLAWHYEKGVAFYLSRYSYTLRAIIHYFSLPILITSMFAPYKRLIVEENTSGFNLGVSLSNLSFNIISRMMGAVVRVILLIAGIFSLVFFAIFGLFGFVIWFFIPFVSLGIYEKFKNSPKHSANELWQKMVQGQASHVFLSSQPGIFMALRLGISSEKLKKSALAVNLSVSPTPQSFEEITKRILEAQMWNDLFFREENIKKEDLIIAARWWDKKLAENQIAFEPPKYYSSGLGRELLFGFTPLLRQYSTDMGSGIDFSHHLIGRQDVVKRMERTLTGGKSIILTGEPGVGKKTVVYEFAKRASQGELGRDLAFSRVLELDYNFLFSKTTDKNKKKQELAKIFNESSSAGNIILVLRDLHRIVDNQKDGMDLTDILEAHLEKGQLKIISISTNEDFEKYLARNARLRKFFENIEVKEPTSEEAYEILLEAADLWEKRKKIIITIPALNKIMAGSQQYITDTPFPEKVLELLDAVVFLEEQKGNDNTITVDDVNATLSEKTGISFASLNTDEKTRLQNLEEIIHERLVNQEKAVSLISKILRSKSLGIISSNRPIGSFLFLGPTGVGKTETAKVLAKVYFGDKDKMIRFDMAEYVGREGLERLIGSIDKNMPGALTTAIKNNPASLLLLDEIEKAPPEIFNLFLAMLDEGVITDAFGKKINCQNLFVIATSNAGAGYIRQLVSEKETNLQDKVVNKILKDGLFSPELINRFDGVVVYEPLTGEHLVKVAQVMLYEMAANLEKQNITLEFSEEAIEKLASDGYAPEFGARPMRRIIELSLGDVIGKALLSGEIKPGDSVLILPGEKKEEFKWEKI